MPSENPYLVEAHSYAGGIRYTSYPIGAPRPPWAPPPDCVGWRDELELGPNDTVVEYSQRSHNGEQISWIAVYRRSIDARFGDRNNHAGIGVWLRRERIADAHALVTSLYQLAVALASSPDPEALNTEVSKFASDRFLESYLVSATLLPNDWAGAPPSNSPLADTKMFAVIAPSFDAAVDSICGSITKWSLAWDRRDLTPRSLIIITDNSEIMKQNDVASLTPVSTFLADIIERVPVAFERAREELQVAERALLEAEERHERKLKSLQDQWEEETRRSETLDGSPVTLENIARRLNELTRQVSEIRIPVYNNPEPRRPETFIRRTPVISRHKTYVAPVQNESILDNPYVYYGLWAFVVIALVSLIAYASAKYVF